ncbi:hypothetical protein L3X38_003422 [Prunus dulcis]|uniref:Uncharacterized protein n=1 Tax=Prunus dulcis TaxID=3755 RepID=A0AAD4ZM12_PRUDU|nr:hypothetical protein L3X38_003422 [Prunus dulcis]
MLDISLLLPGGQLRLLESARIVLIRMQFFFRGGSLVAASPSLICWIAPLCDEFRAMAFFVQLFKDSELGEALNCWSTSLRLRSTLAFILVVELAIPLACLLSRLIGLLGSLFRSYLVVVPKCVALCCTSTSVWQGEMVSSRYSSHSVRKPLLKANDATWSSHPTMFALSALCLGLNLAHPVQISKAHVKIGQPPSIPK